jgi:hypothetical protein
MHLVGGRVLAPCMHMQLCVVVRRREARLQQICCQCYGVRVRALHGSRAESMLVGACACVWCTQQLVCACNGIMMTACTAATSCFL